MDWILEHLKVVVMIGAAVVYFLNQRKKARLERDFADSESRRESAPASPANVEAERVRRIQEEIRRKILERAGGASGRRLAPAAAPAAALSPVETPEAPPAPRSDAQPVPEDAEQAMLARQEALTVRLAEYREARRRAATSRSAEFTEETLAALENLPVRGSVLADLQDPVVARRAIVLREVLGTPVGLR